MAGFIQIIEFESSKQDEIRQLADSVTADPGASTVRRTTVTADRDHPGRYFTVVEFDSYESAMENSKRPETAAFAAKMAELCDGPPVFRNLDVVETWTP